MDNKNNFLEHIKAMSTEELLEYKSSVKIAGRLCAFAGISVIFLSLVFTNIFMLSLAAIVLYIVGNLAVGVDTAGAVVSAQLKQLGVR